MIDRVLLNAYVDGELTADERRVVEAALAESEALQREVASIRSLKSYVAAQVQPITCPETWRRSVGRLDEIDRARKIESFVGRNSWALCGAVALILVAGGLFSERPGHRESRSAAFAQASAGFLSPGAARRTQDEVIDRALRGMIDQTRTAMLQGPLVREDGVYQGPNGPFARFSILDKGAEITMVITSALLDMNQLEVIPGEPGYFIAKTNGENLVVWRAGNASMFLSGDVDHAVLVAFAKQYCVPPGR